MPISTAIFLAILVNCLWGTAFLVPYYFSDVDPALIALGRYLSYGIVSLVIIVPHRHRFLSLTPRQWGWACWYAFAGNLGYYWLLTSSISFSGITPAALIVGALPITMSLVGNAKEKTTSYSQLLVPIILIVSGIATLKIGKLLESENSASLQDLFFGLGLAVLCLVLWTWYGVSNALFLKNNPNISNHVWSGAIGVGCLAMSVVGLAAWWWSNGEIAMQKLDKAMTAPVVLSCIFLGVVVSWLATLWWNQASRILPVALVGQIIVFETLSGLSYGFIADGRFPTWSEATAATLLIVGVVLGIRRLSRPKTLHSELASSPN